MAVTTDTRKTGLPGGVLLLAQSGVAQALTGSTTETTLATLTIPGGLVGPNGMLRITVDMSGTNNANVKTLRVKYGGTTFFNFGNNNFAAWGIETRIRNAGAVNSQVGSAGSATGFSVSTSAPSTGAIDTSVDQTLLLTGQLALGTDSFTILGYTVEVVN